MGWEEEGEGEEEGVEYGEISVVALLISGIETSVLDD